MVLSVRSLQAMASTVRCFVQTKSWTKQVAEPSSDRAMRYYHSPEQAVHHPHNSLLPNLIHQGDRRLDFDFAGKDRRLPASTVRRHHRTRHLGHWMHHPAFFSGAE